MCADPVADRRRQATSRLRLRARGGGLARGRHRAGRGRRLDHRAQHAAPADDRGRDGRRARRSSARSRSAASPSTPSQASRPRAGRRRRHRGRLLLRLVPARPARPRAHRQRRARRDHPLPRALPVDVRQRRPGPADLAVLPRPGRLRRDQRHPQPLGGDGPVPRRAASPRSSAWPTRRSRAARCPPAPPATTASAARRTRPGEVENEDFASMLCRFEAGATGTFEASRTVVGPESQNAFEIYGTKGSLIWNHERINELQYYAVTDSPNSGYTTVFGGERFPFHGAFVPGRPTASGSRTSSPSRTSPSSRRSPPGSRSARGSPRPSTSSACSRPSSTRGSRGAGRPCRTCEGEPADEHRPHHHRRGARALPHRPAHRGRRPRGPAVPGRLRDLRARQRHEPRPRARAAPRRAPGLARPDRGGHGAGAAVAFGKATRRRQVMVAHELDRPRRDEHGHRGRRGHVEPHPGALHLR